MKSQGVVDFFHGTASVSREEFAAFASRLRARFPGIQTLSWLPRVLDDDRADFVQRARAAGLTDFEIRDRTPNGQVTAPRREVYYPSLYIDPPSFSNPGFDPFADPERRSVILSAANTGRPAVTGKIALANGSGFGVLVYAPILTVERRGAYDDVFRSMTSLVVGVFDLPALLEERLADLALPLGEDVYLYDLSATGDERLLAFRPSPTRSVPIAPLTESEAHTGTFLSVAFNVGSRQWAVLLRPSATVVTRAETLSPPMSAGAVLLLAALLARAIEAARTRNREVEQKVEARTRELRDSEERLRLVADALPAMITYVDANQRIQFANRTTADWMARPAKSIVGAFAAPVFGRELTEGTKAAVDDALRGKTSSFAGSFHFADRTTRYVEGINVPRLSPGGEVLGYYTLLLDATERRHLQREVENFFNISLTALATMDYDGRYRTVNPAWVDMFGYSAAEMMELPRGGLTHPDDRARVMELLGHTVVFGEAKRDIEARFVRKDGEVRTGLFMAAPIPDDQLIYFAAIDVTDRKRHEEQIRETRNEAIAAARAKGEFLANMSHEIRTPLNAVIGFSDLALNTALTPKQRDYLLKIRGSGQFLLDLISDILDFSKVEAGKLELEFAEFSLEEILTRVGAVVGLKAADSGLDFWFSVAPDVPDLLVGDSVRLTQVLVNLTGNAVKFTAAGEVAVRVEWAQSATGGRKLRFTVTDTGIGMTPETLSKLFQPFQQADASTTRRFGGTGLGLAISRQVVEMMSGEIGVTSNPGSGSTFWFTIEVATAASAIAPSPIHTSVLLAQVSGT